MSYKRIERLIIPLAAYKNKPLVETKGFRLLANIETLCINLSAKIQKLGKITNSKKIYLIIFLFLEQILS